MKPVTSIRKKMMWVVMTTTFFALLVSATALLLFELRAFRASGVEDLQTQAKLVAQSSVTALSFDDPRVARENLALLRLRPQIQAAAIYDARGNSFADYVVGGQAVPPPRLARREPGPVFEGDRLELQMPIERDGEQLGTLYLRAHYDVASRLRAYLTILVAVSAASLILAGLVARRLQRTVTEPIVAVAEVAREVVQQRNYALRAAKMSDDEVGALVDAFNDMLRELGGQAAALQAADRRKDEFLAILAHELRNPLAPLTTALAILARSDGDGQAELRSRMRGIMERQLRQLVRLIDDLLDVSRISTGRLALQLQTLDLVEVARSAVESVASTMQARRHALVVDWPAAPIWVSGDEARLAQVLINLLNNAAKYTEPGGRVELVFVAGEGEVELRVVDNGHGIDPALQAQVFEMFMQVEPSLERGRAGLGVGLALARELVGLHGGAIELRSAGLGQGSTFVVRLPRLTAAPDPSVPPPGPGATAARPLRVLIADDNRDFADSLGLMLEAVGYRVQVVHDGAAALAAARASLPEVGLFDIGMPGLNGYELAGALREQRRRDEFLMVAITGWGQENDQRRAREAGFDRHLVKPVDVPALLALLAAWADQAAAAVASER